MARALPPIRGSDLPGRRLDGLSRGRRSVATFESRAGCAAADCRLLLDGYHKVISDGLTQGRAPKINHQHDSSPVLCFCWQCLVDVSIVDPRLWSLMLAVQASLDTNVRSDQER